MWEVMVEEGDAGIVRSAGRSVWETVGWEREGWFWRPAPSGGGCLARGGRAVKQQSRLVGWAPTYGSLLTPGPRGGAGVGYWGKREAVMVAG